MYLNELNQEEAARIIAKDPIVLLPTGAVEVHGDHLPLGTDLYLAQALTDKIVEELGPENCLVLPGLPYGQVWSLRDTKGTIDVPDKVLVPFLTHIALSMHRSGISRMAFINGHVGNKAAIKAAMRQVFAQSDMKLYAFTYPGADRAAKAICDSRRPHEAYFHADEIETSYMLYLAPEHVEMERAIVQYPEFPSDLDYSPTPWTRFMDKAVLGDATQASAEKGKAMIDVVEKIVRVLKE